MGVFSSGGVGLDLGSANTTICLENEGIVLREPSYLLTLREDPEEVLAIGRSARQMLGRTPDDVFLLTPVVNGAVADIDMAALLIRTLAEKALGKRRALERNRLVVSVSTACTRVELNAARSAVHSLGAKGAALIRSTAAAALGSGIDFTEPRARVIVLIGSATTEVSVLASGGVVAARTSRSGSLAMDEAIMRYVRREKGIIIGQRTAEDLKIDLAAAGEIPSSDVQDITLRGREARTGKPSTVELSSVDIQKAILPVIDGILEDIREAFENTPAEFAEDILTRGVHLCGGGALLSGLPDRLSKLLGVPVHTGENPQDEVALGACRAASEAELFEHLRTSGCLIEV